MQPNPRFDDFLFTIVKETGGLEGLVHSFFSFLARRTDFFYEADPGDKMGFPPGYAQRMLMNVMDTYQKEHYKKYPKKDPAEYAAKAKKLQEALEKEKASAEEAKTQTTAQTKTTESTVPLTNQNAGQNIAGVTQQKTESSEVMKPEKEQGEAESANKSAPIKDPNATSISTYNGAATEKYNWSQGISEVTVQIPIPAGTRAKNMIVDMGPTKLKVRLRADNSTIIEGEWFERIKADDSTWSVDDDSIIFNLEKANENIWKSVLKGDKEIDATKVDNSKPIDSFDPETQGALRKIMHEQHRKQMGLPSTEEEQQMEMMKKAWDAEGSPFKGTPFDPSKFNMSGSNSMNFGNN